MVRLHILAIVNRFLPKRQNGVNTYRSIKFALKRTGRGAGAGSSSSNTMSRPPVGTVTARFYETIIFLDDDMVEQQVDTDKTNRLNVNQSSSAPAVASASSGGTLQRKRLQAYLDPLLLLRSN